MVIAHHAVQPTAAPSLATKFYAATWRWHFYAGLYVIPFLMILAITGLIMVYGNATETRFGARQFVAAEGQPLSVDDQAAAARAIFPDGTPTQYIAPPLADRASLFHIEVDGKAMIVAVDPYSGRVLNTLEKNSTWFYFASAIHGTLLIGDFGDRLLEIAAGLAIILIVTGLYLWWPRTGRSLSRALLPDLAARGRQFWKELHVSAGFYVSILMLLFLLSGLAWTGVWGEKYVQAWSSFPAEKWDNVPLSDLTHASMNHGALHDVPWGLEQTPMPRSIPAAATVDQLPSRPVTLESIGALAREIGFAGRFRINLPGDETGVYTISADSMDGDTADPTGDRTVHVDQYSGKVLAEVGFADYGMAAKAMAVGIALHQADMGLGNTILNTAFCLTVIFLCISGMVMWWQRRPSGALRLAAPPPPSDLPLWKSAVVIALGLSLAFPLAGLALITAIGLDLLLLSRIPMLKRAFS